MKTDPIQAAPPVQFTDFWCQRCKKDRYLLGKKHVNTQRHQAVYEARCGCKAILRRHITDPKLDKFFKQSKILHDMRNQYARDLIQRNDPRFASIYGKTEEQKKLDESKQVSELRRWNRRGASQSFFGT